MEISLHIAEGLTYLHTPKVGILHRDLAARNVLVVSDGSCKLADFGLARSVGEGETYVATSAIPVRWSAPEVLRESKVTQAADCYSLAMTMVEVFSAGQEPLAHLKETGAIIAAVVTGTRPEQPPRCPGEVFEIMEALWAEERKERLSAADAVKQLAAVLAENDADSDTYALADADASAYHTPANLHAVYASVFQATGALSRA